MDPLLLLAGLFLLSRMSSGGTTTRRVGDIVINSFSDGSEVVTSSRSSFKTKVVGGGKPVIIEQFRGDPTADYIAVYGRATG